MATSTFGKQFKVRSEKASDFVSEMSRAVAPTLKKDFKSRLKHEKELKGDLHKALK